MSDKRLDLRCDCGGFHYLALDFYDSVHMENTGWFCVGGDFHARSFWERIKGVCAILAHGHWDWCGVSLNNPYDVQRIIDFLTEIKPMLPPAPGDK